MGLLKTSRIPTCLSSQHCSNWARIHLKYCLCDLKDGMALFLGIVSIISWGIAEVPQIITNYQEKSTEGLSVAFLLTWVVGDLFNLIGCQLEPATLPTQSYVAVLYTATTLLLTGQTIYYGHIYHRFKANKAGVPGKSQKYRQENASVKESLLEVAMKTGADDYLANGANPSKEGNISSSPIPVAGQVLHDSNGKDFYFMSARYLKKSPVPTFGYWLAHLHGIGRSSSIYSDQLSASIEPLLNGHVSTQSAPPTLDTKNMLSVVPSAALFLVICVLHLGMSGVHTTPPDGTVLLVGRKLLQDKVQDDGSNSVGTFLGWAMAAIYVGGRLPQICLNIRRGNVQGLNPLMFLFALAGNATYVGSILVKSLDWSRVRPNLPWLVDAGGCVMLDAFILIQFVYFYPPKHSKPDFEIIQVNGGKL